VLWGVKLLSVHDGKQDGVLVFYRQLSKFMRNSELAHLEIDDFSEGVVEQRGALYVHSGKAQAQA
jgi:hypothetical protein